MLEGHKDTITSVALGDNGVALTGSMDGKAMLWHLESGIKLATYHEHTGPVLTVTFSKDGWFILTGSEDCTVKVWTSITDQSVYTLKGHKGPV